MKLKKQFIQSILLFFIAMLLFSCGGPKPEGSWTSAEYFKYAMTMYEDEDYFEAVNEFTVITLRYPGSVYSDSAQFYLGMCHFYMDEQIIAAAEFNKLIEEMGRSPLVPDAQYMLGESFYQLSPRAELDQEYTIQAIKQFQIYLEDYPTHEKKEDVEKKLLALREKLAEKQWRNADIYRKMLKLRSSLIYYDIVLNNFYDTEFADDAQYGKALVYIDLEEWDNAKDALMMFKEKYSDSELIEEVKESLVEVEQIEKEVVEESANNQ